MKHLKIITGWYICSKLRKGFSDFITHISLTQLISVNDRVYIRHSCIWCLKYYSNKLNASSIKFRACYLCIIKDELVENRNLINFTLRNIIPSSGIYTGCSFTVIFSMHSSPSLPSPPAFAMSPRSVSMRGANKKWYHFEH